MPNFQTSQCMFTVCRFLPRGEGGDEGGGLLDLAGGNGMSGRSLGEDEAGWGDCEVMVGEKGMSNYM